MVGMACRFPGGEDVPSVLATAARRSGRDPEVPPDRWDVDAYYDPDPDAPGKMYTRYGGFLDRIDRFDAAVLRHLAARGGAHGPAAAAAAGGELGGARARRRRARERWPAARPASSSASRTSDYAQLLAVRRRARPSTPTWAPATAHSVGGGPLCLPLGLQGPSLAVDTACSSSLVAVHLACQSLRNGECELALAGGVNLILTPERDDRSSAGARMLSADGRCKTFDASADGYVRGEGCGVVVLKRLSDAQRDGDRILAVIRGAAVNQDGRSSGLTVPNGPAQER